MRRRTLLAGVGGAMAGCAAAPTGPATVTFDAVPGRLIAPDFIGLSYEKNRIWTRLFTDPNLAALLRQLGPGVLRIGANSGDRTPWDPVGAGGVYGRTAPADIARLAAFTRSCGWRMIYGLNLGADDPAAAADEAAVAVREFGDALLGLEIGNEPDIFRSNGLRSGSYAYADFAREWSAFAAAIRQRAPGVKLTGPATAYQVAQYTLPFAHDLGDQIVLLTQHYYRANGQAPGSTIDLLLQPDPKLLAMLPQLTDASRNMPLGWRMAECNSFYNGGAPGISNGYGTALWLLEFLVTLARAGAAGVNLHGGGNGPGYTSIGDNGSHALNVRPLYDAMLLFSRLSGARLLPTTVAAGGALTAQLVTRDGRLSALLVNPGAAQITVLLPAGTSGRAGIIRLTGTSLLDPAGTMLGGQPVITDGRWLPREENAVASGGYFPVAVPAISAALVAWG